MKGRTRALAVVTALVAAGTVGVLATWLLLPPRAQIAGERLHFEGEPSAVVQGSSLRVSIDGHPSPWPLRTLSELFGLSAGHAGGALTGKVELTALPTALGDYLIEGEVKETPTGPQFTPAGAGKCHPAIQRAWLSFGTYAGETLFEGRAKGRLRLERTDATSWSGHLELAVGPAGLRLPFRVDRSAY